MIRYAVRIPDLIIETSTYMYGCKLMYVVCCGVCVQETWEKVRLAEEDGTIGRRAAEEERQKAAGLVQKAYSGGYEHPIEVGGAVFTPLVLSP